MKEQLVICSAHVLIFTPHCQLDIDTIEDPMRRNAVISFIHNFGQMPKQLFKRAHRPRRVFTGTVATTGSPLTDPALLGNVIQQVFFKNLPQLLPSKEPVKSRVFNIMHL